MPGLTQRLGVSITKECPHVFIADEWRVPNHKDRFWPFRLPWVNVPLHNGPGSFIGNCLSRYLVHLHGLPVPPSHWLAISIQQRLFSVVFENGVPAFDVVEGFDDRLSGHSRSEGAKVP